MNLSAIVGKSVEAKERRLVPEVIENFFVQAAPMAGVFPKETQRGGHLYRVGRVPRPLLAVGEQLEPRFGRLGREYKQIVFDKTLLMDDPTLEWVTPGHPLFEALRQFVWDHTQGDLRRGAVFFDLHRNAPARLDVFSAAIRDGRGHVLHRRLFVVQTDVNGTLSVRQPTIFLDLIPAPAGTTALGVDGLPGYDEVEQALVENPHNGLQVFLDEVARSAKRLTPLPGMVLSLNELIHRQNMRMGELLELQQAGDTREPLAANIRLTEERLDELNNRLERRMAELDQERHCTIADIQHHGRAWVLPHPERNAPGIAPMVRDDEIERIAVEAVTAFEEAHGWYVESVEKENRGYDLISRKAHPEDPQTAVAVRFIEVKGRAGVGEVALTAHEHDTAVRLQDDFWLYVVYNCASNPDVHPIQNPARLGWEPIVTIEHYRVGPDRIMEAAEV